MFSCYSDVYHSVAGNGDLDNPCKSARQLALMRQLAVDAVYTAYSRRIEKMVDAVDVEETVKDGNGNDVDRATPATDTRIKIYEKELIDSAAFNEQLRHACEKNNGKEVQKLLEGVANENLWQRESSQKQLDIAKECHKALGFYADEDDDDDDDSAWLT